MSSMGRSKIGYSIDGEPKYHSWNPIGMGCSNGCPDCWARGLSKRLAKDGCQDCLNFRVHFHRERLPQLDEQRNSKLVLCNFTGDWMDKERAWGEVFEISRAMAEAPQHTYITLTKNASRAAQHALYAPTGGIPDNWWMGLTIRNQADADAKLPDFLGIPGNLWISFEPAEGEVDWGEALLGAKGKGARHYGKRKLMGIILGQNNKRKAPGTATLAHLRSTVKQCKAAGVNWFVKQIWMGWCEGCGVSLATPECWDWGCPECQGPMKRRLLRASHPDEYALYPDWARGGELPWPANS